MTPRPKKSPRPRVLLTRSEEDCAEWAARFAEHGAEAIALPCIRCEPIATSQLGGLLSTAVTDADWLVFTSRRGVEAFAALASSKPSPGCHIAVVGAATAEAAKAALGRVDLVGRGGTAAALAATLVGDGHLKSRPKVVLALAENAGDELEQALTAAGATCTRFDLYRTVPASKTEPRRPLSALHVDNVVLASPSAVLGFVNSVDVDVPVRIYTIGPSTTAAARKAGLSVTGEAGEPSLEGILEAIEWRN
jgi:uroporphyrinogen III methyltransferase / synthase